MTSITSFRVSARMEIARFGVASYIAGSADEVSVLGNRMAAFDLGSDVNIRGRVRAMPFNFTDRIQAVVEDMVDRLDELKHIDVSRIAFSFAQARKRTQYGIHASLTPMRFEAGALTTRRRGVEYTVQRLYDGRGDELLYILNFYLPRFMDVDFEEKLVTVLHELWHISPDFDGDLRRHPGRCYAHTHSQDEYDARMKVLADQWLAKNPPQQAFDFLHLSFSELAEQYGAVIGRRVPHPKLIPLAAHG